MKQILVFILFSAMLCWLMFSPVYKHIIIMRQALLQKEVDFMLEVGASGKYGYIDAFMIQASRKRLEDRGFTAADLAYSISSTSGAGGMSASQPLSRGTGLQLTITYPYHRLFIIDQLIGMSVPSANERMGASGMKMSEYVP